jgi:hypothetical protein
MKVKLTHVLIALLAIIIIFNLGKNVVEGMENKHKHGGNHKGIKKGNVPEGDEDLYILKSEIVPPVCPKCPDAASCPRAKPCEPCPPCARCPEPAFTCKKVPNYRSQNQSELPMPMLNTFAAFK